MRLCWPVFKQHLWRYFPKFTYFIPRLLHVPRCHTESAPCCGDTKTSKQISSSKKMKKSCARLSKVVGKFHLNRFIFLIPHNTHHEFRFLNVHMTGQMAWVYSPFYKGRIGRRYIQSSIFLYIHSLLCKQFLLHKDFCMIFLFSQLHNWFPRTSCIELVW